MDVNLYRLEVIQGKESIAEEWLSFLNDNKEQSLKTLENEEVYFESYFKEIIDGRMIIYLFIMCKSLEFANQVAINSTNELDIKHFAYMKECIDLQQGNIMSADIMLDNRKHQERDS